MKLCGSQNGGRHWARKVFSYATVCSATTVQWSSETAPETSPTMITGSQQKLDGKLAGPLAALSTDTLPRLLLDGGRSALAGAIKPQPSR